MTAEHEKVNLIVMGARGFGPIKERVFGSVSHRVLTQAPCAKLIVNGPVKAMRQVLVPLAGSIDTEAAIHFLKLKPFGEAPELILFTVFPELGPPWPIPADVAAQLEKDEIQRARQFLDDAAARIRVLGYPVKTQVVVGKAVESILNQAKKLGSDLILMGSRGRHGTTRFLLGSVSHAVLHEMPCPVLILPTA